MIPPLIVQDALNRGIELIAITDHNASANVAAVQKAAEGTGLAVLPGMELQTREEVHCLCLFDSLDQLEGFTGWVQARLPDLKNRPETFGEQFVVDETGDFLRREEQMLLASANCSLDEAFRQVSELGGLMIPAHINRTHAGLIAVLGFVPEDIPFEALEISRHLTPDEAVRRYPQTARYPLIQSGDVHRLDEYLGVTQLEIERACVAEIRMAFSGKNGRKCTILALPDEG